MKALISLLKGNHEKWERLAAKLRTVILDDDDDTEHKGHQWGYCYKGWNLERFDKLCCLGRNMQKDKHMLWLLMLRLF